MVADSIIVLAPMAGITDAEFCMKLIPYGFDAVTLGGYNADEETSRAGRLIAQRGRPEFDFDCSELKSIVESEASLIKDSFEVLVSVNLRALDPEPIMEISSIGEVDIVEINAHCRQPEITSLGAGQAMLHDPEFLEDFTSEVVRGAHAEVSVKVRGNVPGVATADIAEMLDDLGVSYIHLDAMKPGEDRADLELVSEVSQNLRNAVLIGNNSVRDPESAAAMLAAGADAVSVARAAISGRMDFNLREIRFNLD
ncbi:MJ0144 family RNA dihydrouridine synthase-like protein [Methanothermobacter sp.]|uniref:MJ0144 family RNA dihydrouridine synthase-like protein n=1 Tax=Methanothermobacter sp. TaxID=1884223 RepID=UPI003C71652E